MAEVGDQYVFLALADTAKAIISYRVGERNGENTRAIVANLHARVLGIPEISADAFNVYPVAVDLAFGLDCHFGMVEKHYAVGGAVEAARRYAPAQVVSVSKRHVVGRPRHISTSCVERQNLPL